MDAKLTVRVEQRWLDEAKRYAARHGTSLSRMINEYLRHLPATEAIPEDPPILRRLTGILPPDVSIDEYHQYLGKKHGG